MTSDTTRFPVTIVSTDTTALRELSWTLSSHGYQVVASSDWSEHAAWQQMDSPSLLLLDARNSQEIQAVLSSPRSTPFVYRIAFYDATAADDSEPLIDLGADDLISYPVNTGELLTRIKSGFRRLEFERRFALAKMLDQQTGIATRSGFVQQLERLMSDGSDTKDGALIVVSIDYLDLICSKYGSFAAEEAATTLAQCLSDQLADEDFCGVLQAGVFAVLLQDSTVDEGIQFAEIVAEEVNIQESSLNKNGTQLSVSGVVLNWPSGASAHDAIERGLTDLAHVKSFGGDLILDANEVEQDFSAWQQHADDGSHSRAVSARHVMEALPLVLPIDGLISTDKQSLGIFAFTSDQTLPPCIPVVDEQGGLLGIIDPSSLAEHGNDVFESLDEHLVPVPATVQGNQPLDEIVSTMEIVQEDYLVVVENEKPVGFVTSENLAPLSVDPIDEESTSQQTQAEASLASLVVPLS